jgi:hypothetical protein
VQGRQNTGYGAAVASDDHFFAGLYLVQQLAQMCFRVNQADSDHRALYVTIKLVII